MATAVAVDAATPPNIYVTGFTVLGGFPAEQQRFDCSDRPGGNQHRRIGVRNETHPSLASRLRPTRLTPATWVGILKTKEMVSRLMPPGTFTSRGDAFNEFPDDNKRVLPSAAQHHWKRERLF